MYYEIIKTVNNQIRFSWVVDENSLPTDWSTWSVQDKAVWIEENGTPNEEKNQEFLTNFHVSYDDVRDVEYL